MRHWKTWGTHFRSSHPDISIAPAPHASALLHYAAAAALRINAPPYRQRDFGKFLWRVLATDGSRGDTIRK